MKTKLFSVWIRKLLAAAFATAAVFGGLFFSDPAQAELRDQTAEETALSNIEEVQPGWWETRKRIYFDIPARVRFRLPEGDAGKAEEIASQAWAEFDRIGTIFNPYAADSEVARLNSADAARPIPVSTDMWRVFEISSKLWQASGGAFDPTMLPVKRLWQDAMKTQKVPPTRLVRGTLSKVGFNRVRLIEKQRAVQFEAAGMQFDFGGVVKGYAVDRVFDILKKNGIAAGLVQLGGEVAAFGQNDDNFWRIGIQDPTDMASVWGILSDPSSIRVSTSGNYRQPLVIEGHEFYHIFSPKTGLPVSEKILGVTTADFTGNVSNALLDGAATAITVMGAERGLSMAKALGIEALVLKRNGDAIQEFATEGFERHYRSGAEAD